jgi:hypothetical protein
LGYNAYIHRGATRNCVASLNKQKCHILSFTKSDNRRVEQVLPWRGGWYQWEGRRGRKSVAKIVHI